MAMLVNMAVLPNMAMLSLQIEARMRSLPYEQRPDGVGREREMLGALELALDAAGWKRRAVERGPEDRRPDIIASRKGVKLAIEVKAMAEGRADRLIPLWSQAWLQALNVAPQGHIPMAVVGAERVAPKAADAVIEFIAQVAPGASGGVMDLAGLRRFVGPQAKGLNAEPVPLPRRSERPTTVRGKLFSDLNQWMLKLLLAPDIPERMLNAPRSQYQGVSDLGAAAGVSVMSASRLIQELRQEGYLDDAAPQLRLVRVRHLLERWQAAVAALPVEEQPWRALIKGRAGDAVGPWLEQDVRCLALFSAASEHGLGFVKGVPPYLYARRSAPAPPGFAPAEAGEAPDLILRWPRAPQSVFRGIVNSRGRPASDILQVWLDVASHPTRGREQADLIWRKVLEPLCEPESA